MYDKLVLITISGVQNYISEAQKTKDFHNGSEHVIEYVKKIYQTISIEYKEKIELLIPTEIEDDYDYDIPNYMIMKFNLDYNCNLENELRIKLWSKLKNSQFPPLDVYIVAVDLDYNYDYETQYKKLYRRLEGFKNDRFKNNSLIKQTRHNYDANDNNCIICGIRKVGSNKDSLCEICYEKRKRRDNASNYSSVDAIAAAEWTEKINKNFQGINKTTETKNTIGASRYYALVKADMDDLGKHFSGKYSSLIKNLSLLEFQQMLSSETLEFGRKVKENINKHESNKSTPKLYIYSGGDDILFFSPLNKVFKFMDSIDENLYKINKEMSKDYGKSLTLSRSIVISHSTIPLQKTIEISRQSLEMAKNKFSDNNKNALAIVLINSSNNVRTSFLKYSEGNIKKIKTLINEFKNNIPRSFIFDLEKEVALFNEQMDVNEYKIIRGIISNSIERLMKNKNIGYEKCKIAEKIDIMNNLLSEFEISEGTNYFIDMDGYFNLLHIMDKYSLEIIENLDVNNEVENTNER